MTISTRSPRMRITSIASGLRCAVEPSTVAGFGCLAPRLLARTDVKAEFAEW
jgi:hypothetical protein